MPPLTLPVIARSAATKQSILSLRGEMDCFAALAMTAGAMDCFAEPSSPVGGYDASGEAARRRHWAELVRRRSTSDAEPTKQSSNRHSFRRLVNPSVDARVQMIAFGCRIVH